MANSPTRYHGSQMKKKLRFEEPLPYAQLETALEHVVWEYACFLGTAREMATSHPPPRNHLFQNTYLIHARSLMGFLYSGAEDRKKRATGWIRRKMDDIYAVDFCDKVGWDNRAFSNESKLAVAINKTLTHLTYSRNMTSPSSQLDSAFHGPSHLHGTTRLFVRAMEKFSLSLLPEFRQAYRLFLDEKEREWNIAAPVVLAYLDTWATQARASKFLTPDGLIPE